MVCNIPRLVSYTVLSSALDSSGFKGKYDYLDLPLDVHSFKHDVSNLGYAFVNFPDRQDLESFKCAFNGYEFDITKYVKKVMPRLAQLPEEKP